MKIGTGVQELLRFCLSSLKGCNVGITEWKGFMKSAVEMGSCGMIYLPSFLKIGTGVEGILKFCLSNLKGCNAGITA
jgi:hypothetical protein